MLYNTMWIVISILNFNSCFSYKVLINPEFIFSKYTEQKLAIMAECVIQMGTSCRCL